VLENFARFTKTSLNIVYISRREPWIVCSFMSIKKTRSSWLLSTNQFVRKLQNTLAAKSRNKLAVKSRNKFASKSRNKLTVKSRNFSIKVFHKIRRDSFRMN
jgi:hypothetical protein